MELRKLLVAVDFSDASSRAVEWALDVAERVDAKVEVLHVWEAPAWFVGTFAEVANAEAGSKLRDAYDAAGRSLQETLARHDGARLSPKLLVGTPWKVICERADIRGHDVVVIGTHGRSGPARVLHGSVAEQVVRHAPCPVVVMR